MKDESDISDSVNRQITELKARVTELEDALLTLSEPVAKIKGKRTK